MFCDSLPANMYECIEVVGEDPCIKAVKNTFRKKKTDFARSQPHFNPRDNRHQSSGFRKQRRIANLNELTNEGEKEEDDSCQVEYIDLINRTPDSAFTQLFTNSESMSLWNSYINGSEEEQQDLLRRGSRANLSRDYGEDFGEENPSCLSSTVFSASQCFLRINHNLRQFLRKNQFPKGELQRQEEELVTFFQECPDAVYVTQIPDSFRRMMLHIVSQYLDLSSHSFDNPPGIRKTIVESRERAFMPPITSLATFLKRSSKSSPMLAES